MPPHIAPERGALIGFWGKPTSTLDWCEENYVLTYYVAEFWNTLSNASMVLPALVGLWATIRYRLETRYLVGYLALLAVGIGSTFFHGTLLYEMQLLDELPMLILSAFVLFALYLLDELPMLFGTSVLLYTLYEMGEARGMKSAKTYIVAGLLFVYCTVVSLVYVFVNDPTFHEIAYGIMVVAIALQSFYCLRNYNSWKYLYFGIASFAIYAVGFMLWNVDNNLCPDLRGYRKALPSPVGTMTQFHAWWHLFAGFGTYLQALLSSRVRMEYLKYSCSLKFACGIPYLEVREGKC